MQNKNDFTKLINNISGSKTAYERYIYAKNNKENKRELLVSEGKKIYEYITDYLVKIERKIK